MKTLNEVITGLDICKNFSYCTHPQKGECPYLYEDNTCGQDDLYRDALHYLKAYRKVQSKIEKIALGNIADTLDKLDNPPLTWDELKSMEGKPVWVEDEDCYNKWEIINGVYDDGISFGDYFLNKNEFGTVWQAYRKERTDVD